MKLVQLQQYLVGAFLMLLATSCYKEQHFELPGPWEDDVVVPDTLPFPFDTTRQKGIYLVKDGVPDFNRISFRGYSDYKPVEEQNSWFYNESQGCYESRQHHNFYPIDDKDYYGEVWNSYQSVFVSSKVMVEYKSEGSWYFYGKVAFPYLAGTAPYIWFGESWGKRHLHGFDGGAGFNGNSVMFAAIYGKAINDDKWPTTIEVITPGEPFDLEVVCVDFMLYFKINGRLIWVYNVPKEEHAHPFTFVPWRNSLQVYDIYLEGDISEPLDFVDKDEKETYASIQSPSLAKKQGGELLMFGEGRVNNYELYKSNELPEHRSNATDIILKRSNDEGERWSTAELVAGGDGSVNINPNVVVDQNDKIHLIYTKDNSSILNDTLFAIYYQSGVSNATEIREDITSSIEGKNDYLLSTVNGHGVELSDGTICFPVLARNDSVHTAGILKKNIDDEWKLTVVPGKDESDVALATGVTISRLNDGRLMLLMANKDNQKEYRVSYSADNGETWSPSTFSGITTGAFGTRHQGTTVTKDNEIIHIGPRSIRTSFGGDNPMPGAPAFGENIGVIRQVEDDESWSQHLLMNNFLTYSGAYILCDQMDAIVLNSGRIFCITETGVRSPSEGLGKYYID